MFWRYLFFTVLLIGTGIPNTRIFTFASALERRSGTEASEQDDLVDRIVEHLAKKDGTDNQKTVQVVSSSSSDSDKGVNTAQETPAKDVPVVNVAGKTAPQVHHPDSGSSNEDEDNEAFLFITGGCAVVGFIGLMMAGVCYYKFRKSSKAAVTVEYPAYGVTGPMKERVPSPGDRKLAQSAQMYHYQHQKQQMIAMEKANGDMKHDASDDDSEEDNVEGDYTVYECPGLAPTGEMEVKNPLFRGEETPVTPSKETNGNTEQEPTSPHGAEH